MWLKQHLRSMAICGTIDKQLRALATAGLSNSVALHPCDDEIP